MSELKERDARELVVNNHYWPNEESVRVYIKSEADKLIAELEMKLAAARLVLQLNTPEALYSNLETMSRLTHEKYVIKRREHHHKYKRCLAMVKYCEAMCGHYLSYEEPKWFWYRKWSERWLELAEKFKEAK